MASDSAPGHRRCLPTARDLGAERLRGQGHETYLGGTCHGHRNLMSKIIRQHQGLVGHRYPLMCDGYLQQKGRSVADSSITRRLPREAKTSTASIELIYEPSILLSPVEEKILE